MNDYISRHEAIAIAFAASGLGNSKYRDVCDIAERLRKIPAADMVEVVRCKNCKWCHSGYCEKYDDLIPFGCANRPWEEWFCADGARKDGET